MGEHQILGARNMFIVFLWLYSICAIAQKQLAPSFKCMSNNATCQALVGYVPSNTTTLAHIQSAFGVSSFNSLLGANIFPPSTLGNYTIFPNQTVRVPFPCRCSNGTGLSDGVPIYTIREGDGLYFIANQLFSGSTNGTFLGLVTYQQIQAANHIEDPNMIYVGRQLWIPLSCSCDDVEGQKVVHYGHVVAPGSTLDQIATEFETTPQILISVNGITDPDRIIAGQVLDIPLKGQVLDHLASPSKADGAIMKVLASTIPNITGWFGSDFCIWTGVVCNSDGFVTSISLPSQNLTGSLPSNLSSLSPLTSISLENNHLSGGLPSFANLKFLQEINLESNKFTSIPDGAFSGLPRLQILSIDNNPNLNPWRLPVELEGSTILTALSASNVNLYGPIPYIFGNLTSLQIFKLSFNNLTGTLPVSLTKANIEYLWLDHQYTGLFGSLEILAGMNSLRQVWLENNKFTGPIPDLYSSTSIFDLQLHNNQLTGVVPASLMQLPELVNISLQGNRLQGPYPIFQESVSMILGDTNLFCKHVAGNCDPQVMTLLNVAGAFGYPLMLAEAWQGNNVCGKWEFVTCESSRITTLVLSLQGFNGTISPALANLTNLRELYLNNNNLTGTIPDILTTLPELKVIDVSHNDLEGKVPNFRSSVTVYTAGNKHIGSGFHSSNVGNQDKNKRKEPFQRTGKIVLVVLVPAISITVIWILLNAYQKRKNQRESTKGVEQWWSFLQLAPNSPARFTFKALKVATNNFDIHKKLGRGGFGSVFEGNLSDGTKIAVKRLDHLGQGRKEFLAEVHTIGSIHHVNLVKLIGFCAEQTKRLLVYEHMSKGSLDKWIFNTSLRDSLAWVTKKKIILHIAKGLAYLHEECQQRIVHLDVKPQNVLLDDDFNAKLSDFGLAKLIDRDQSFVMTQMR